MKKVHNLERKRGSTKPFISPEAKPEKRKTPELHEQIQMTKRRQSQQK
jgi:hypothetical protein